MKSEVRSNRLARSIQRLNDKMTAKEAEFSERHPGLTSLAYFGLALCCLFFVAWLEPNNRLARFVWQLPSFGIATVFWLFSPTGVWVLFVGALVAAPKQWPTILIVAVVSLCGGGLIPLWTAVLAVPLILIAAALEARRLAEAEARSEAVSQARHEWRMDSDDEP